MDDLWPQAHSDEQLFYVAAAMAIPAMQLETVLDTCLGTGRALQREDETRDGSARRALLLEVRYRYRPFGGRGIRRFGSNRSSD